MAPRIPAFLQDVDVRVQDALVTTMGRPFWELLRVEEGTRRDTSSDAARFAECGVRLGTAPHLIKARFALACRVCLVTSSRAERHVSYANVRRSATLIGSGKIGNRLHVDIASLNRDRPDHVCHPPILPLWTAVISTKLADEPENGVHLTALS